MKHLHLQNRLNRTLCIVLFFTSIFSFSTKAQNLDVEGNGLIQGRLDVNTGTANIVAINAIFNNDEDGSMVDIDQRGSGNAALGFRTNTANWSIGIDQSGGNQFKIGSSYYDLAASAHFTITDLGDIGIGTTSPSGKLHIVEPSSSLDRNQLWLTHDNDKESSIAIEGGNLFYSLGVSDIGEFKIGRSSGLTSSHTFEMDSDGQIRIGGDVNPTSTLHIKQTSVSSATGGVTFEHLTTGNTWDLYHYNDNDFGFLYNDALKAYIQDTDGAYMTTSDRRLKKDIVYVESTLDKVLRIKPATYKYIDNTSSDRRSLGVIAQELEVLFPQLVAEKEGYLGVNYSGLSVVNVKAIQEQQDIINAQAELIKKLEARVSALEKK